MRVLVCGSRTVAVPASSGPESKAEAVRQRAFMWSVLRKGYGRYDVLIQGEAPGADSVAKAWAWNNGVPTEDYTADWKRYGKSAGPRRNAQMLKDGKPDIVLAFIDKPFLESRGTRDMVLKAIDAGVTVHVFDVNLEKEIEISQ